MNAETSNCNSVIFWLLPVNCKDFGKLRGERNHGPDFELSPQPDDSYAGKSMDMGPEYHAYKTVYFIAYLLGIRKNKN